MRRLTVGAMILAVVGFALGVAQVEPESDPDGIEAVMFDENGDVRVEPFARIYLYVTHECSDKEI